jgi:hypothetical protein
MKGVEEVYLEAAVSMINEGALELLPLACGLRGSLNTPSWVPDWTAGNAMASWPWQSNATPQGLQVCHEISNNGCCPYLHGKVIGAVGQRATRGMLDWNRGLSGTISHEKSWSEAFLIMREWLDFARKKSFYPTGERPTDVFLELLSRSTKGNKIGLEEWYEGVSAEDRNAPKNVCSILHGTLFKCFISVSGGFGISETTSSHFFWSVGGLSRPGALPNSVRIPRSGA